MKCDPRRGAGRRAKHRVLALLLLAGLLACVETDPVQVLDEEWGGGFLVEHVLPEGIQVAIRVAKPRLAPGEIFIVESRVTNSGTRVQRLRLRTCGLDILTDMVLEPAWVSCLVYAEEVMLEPGESIVQVEGGYVRATRGRYHLRVRHILSPPTWHDMMIVVRPG